MATLTERARKDIEENVFFTAAESYEYLLENKHFNNVSEALAAEMQILGYEGEAPELAEILAKKMVALDGEDEPSGALKKSVRDWLTLNKIPKRETALKICFALGFSPEQAKRFFRQGCLYPGFNFREAWEVVCYYCLLSGHPYSKACELMAAYNDADYAPAEIEPSHATKTLRDTFSELNWDNELEFLNSLRANKNNFEGYGKTALTRYHAFRNSFCLKIIEDHLNEVLFGEGGDGDDRQDLVYLSVAKVLKNLAKKDAFYIPLAEKFLREDGDLFDIWDEATERFFESNSTAAVTEFLREIVQDDLLLREITGIPYVWTKKNGKESEFVNIKSSAFAAENHHLLDGFPRAQYLGNLERHPEINTNKDFVRKAFILLFFCDYVYDWLVDKKSTSKSYKNFYDTLDGELSDCGMMYLYPRDQFDWLILKSVRSFDFVTMGGGDDPFDFFYDIMSLSFSGEDSD